MSGILNFSGTHVTLYIQLLNIGHYSLKAQMQYQPINFSSPVSTGCFRLSED